MKTKIKPEMKAEMKTKGKRKEEERVQAIKSVMKKREEAYSLRPIKFASFFVLVRPN